MISLSNLLKQCFVVNQMAETRIINADERYNGKNVPVNAPVATSENEIPGSEELLDGFLAGLNAEEVLVEPEINTEELIAQANAQAEAIVSAAQAEAIKIADDARKEAEKIFERSKFEGYNEGASKLRAEVSEERAHMQEELTELKYLMKEEHEAKLKTMESDIVDAMLRVFRHVFDVALEDKKEILLYLIQNTLLNVETGKSLRIRVSSENHTFVKSHIGDIKEKIGNDIAIEVVNDMTLNPTQCMIETESGVFDCGVDTEFQNLENNIRILCG